MPLIRYCVKKYLFLQFYFVGTTTICLSTKFNFRHSRNGSLKFDVVKESQKEGYDALVTAPQQKDRKQVSSDAKHFEFVDVTCISLATEISGECLKSYRIALA